MLVLGLRHERERLSRLESFVLQRVASVSGACDRDDVRAARREPFVLPPERNACRRVAEPEAAASLTLAALEPDSEALCQATTSKSCLAPVDE